MAFEDHHDHKRFCHRFEAVNFESVFAQLQRSGLVRRVQEVR
jgi:hypothetical protein